MYWFCESSAYQAKLKKANENYESHSKNTCFLLLLFIVKQLQLMTARRLIKETETCHILDKRSMTEVRNGNYLHGIGEESLFPCLSKLQNYEVIASDNIQVSLVLSQTLAGTLQEQRCMYWNSGLSGLCIKTLVLSESLPAFTLQGK